MTVLQTAKKKQAPDDTLSSHIRGSLLFFFSVVGIGFFIFLVWSLCAPLDSAVVAQGRVIVSGGTKTVQHPTGGIIAAILVKDGDRVGKDQILVRLNRTREEGELKSVEEEIKATTAVRRSLMGKIRSSSTQLDILKDKLGSLEGLFQEGFVSRYNVMDAHLRREDAQKEFNDFTGRDKEAQSKLKGLKEKQTFLTESLRRTDVRSPVEGVVMDLQHRTEGAVIAPGQRIMDIVSLDEPLVIEAYVMNKDIRRIGIDMPVKVQLDAYKARRMPRLTGKVTHVSADAFDRQSGSFYKVMITLIPDEIKRVTTPLELKAGMPVTVFIVKGSRSLLAYWFDPLADSFYRAMREE